ncbi:hypothetical protein ATANTOWER_018708, partial [Ataeniobius toweri]|nr:hypothetical protein [Ataeniobius toweri]
TLVSMSDHLCTVRGPSQYLGTQNLRSTGGNKAGSSISYQSRDELDEAVRTWNTHQIRLKPAHWTPGGRPVLMFSMPQLYAEEDKFQPVPEEETAVCKEECTKKGQYPCDEAVFELCILLMDENGWDAPLEAFAAAELYSLLRNEIFENLAVH